MKSDKGFAQLKFELLLIVLMLITGVTIYVVMQDNGVLDQLEEKYIQSQNVENEIVEN